jgi:hypothetical protein
MSVWQHALMIYCILDLAALAVFVNYGAQKPERASVRRSASRPFPFH